MSTGKPQATMAVEVIYLNLNTLPHPNQGVIRMMQFGHVSEGQRKITRMTAEALVMLLENNGFHIVNGLSEAAALLRANGWQVEAPGEDPGEDPESFDGDDTFDSLSLL